MTAINADNVELCDTGSSAACTEFHVGFKVKVTKCAVCCRPSDSPNPCQSELSPLRSSDSLPFRRNMCRPCIGTWTAASLESLRCSSLDAPALSHCKSTESDHILVNSFREHLKVVTKH